MSEKKIDLSVYNQDFLLAYDLVSEHVKSGNAQTEHIATTLAELTKVIHEHGRCLNPSPQHEPRK